MRADESELSTGLVQHDVVQRRRGAHVADGADLQTIRRVGENQSDPRLSGADVLLRLLPRRLTHGHQIAVVLLFGGKLTQKGSLSKVEPLLN